MVSNVNYNQSYLYNNPYNQYGMYNNTLPRQNMSPVLPPAPVQNYAIPPIYTPQNYAGYMPQVYAPNPINAVTPNASQVKRIGEMLLEKGLITQEQLYFSLAEAQAARVPVGSVFVKNNLISKEKLDEVLKEQSELKYEAANKMQQTYKNQTPKTNKSKLSLFFINDMHGHFDNMSNILGASLQYDKEMKNKKGVDSIKLSAGDNYTGGDVERDKLMMNFLDYIGIEASAVGNHEFDASTSKFFDIMKTSKVKFLAANANVPAGCKFYDNVAKSAVIQKDGGTYGVVGLLPFDLETVASKKEALEGVRPYSLEESVKLAQAEIDKLRAQGINKIILLSHIGIDKDREIIPMLDGIDIVQGGHTHNLTPELKEGENILKSKSGEPVILLQAGENGKYAGILDVDFDENGIITAASLDIEKADLEKSPVLEHIKTSALGESPKVAVLKGVDPTPENRRIVPCAWTNFLADGMRNELNTDIAFVNAANMRKVPKPGILTERDITETTPLQNTLMVSNMTEKEIVRVVKEAAKASLSYETGEPGIMHVSGLEYKATSDGELLEMSFVDKNGNKTPIDINNPRDDKFYTVAHDTFVAEPRDSMEYPGMAITAHKNQNVQKFNFDKDKTAADYIKKLANNDELEIRDDFRIQIFEKDGSLRTLNKEQRPLNNAPVQTNVQTAA